MELIWKSCKTCNILSSADCFSAQAGRHDGLYPSCKLCVKLRWQYYRRENQAKIATQQRESRKARRHLIRERQNAYDRKRLADDPVYKLRRNLRVRLCQAIRSKQKAGSAISDLGCSVPDLMAYLELRFQEGMTWENWGKQGWHIDHIRPLASYDLTDPAQLREAVHYTNLQPMWATENLKKGARYNGIST